MALAISQHFGEPRFTGKQTNGALIELNPADIFRPDFSTQRNSQPHGYKHYEGIFQYLDPLKTLVVPPLRTRIFRPRDRLI
jgi:hypothetical protein